MLEQYFMEVYNKFKLAMYKKLFSTSETRSDNLSAMENFCAETIHILNRPTANEFADFACISTPNAAYKISNLVRKGYVVKIRSESDRREYYLETTKKYSEDYGTTSEYVETVMKRIRERFPQEDIEKFEEILQVISTELMQECDVDRKNPQLPTRSSENAESTVQDVAEKQRT